MKTGRYFTVKLLIFVMLVSVLNGFVLKTAAQVISIPDPIVKRDICKVLKEQTDCTITKQDMEGLTKLDIVALPRDVFAGITIKNIIGVEYAINLTNFQIHRTVVTDLTPISDLTKLTWVWLVANRIEDISPLAGLVNLDELRLDNNNVSDITHLSGLTKLRTLALGKNPITDISPIAELTNLTRLTLTDNQLTDISPLAELTNLKILNLRDNQIIDISPLTALTNLTLLGLDGNQITDTDLNLLTVFTNLTNLRLNDNQLTDISPLAGLTNLESLSLHGNQISDVSPLTNLTNLKELYIYDNPIKNRKPLLALLEQNPGIKIYLKSRREALPVTLSHFSAEHTDAGIILKWTTESEVDNAGFYIYRSPTKDGEFKVVNTELIQGAGTTGERNEYTWTDTTAKPNTVYYYRIEDVSYAGVREQLATVRLKGLVSAKGKRTTSWADLKGQE